MVFGVFLRFISRIGNNMKAETEAQITWMVCNAPQALVICEIYPLKLLQKVTAPQVLWSSPVPGLELVEVKSSTQ